MFSTHPNNKHLLDHIAAEYQNKGNLLDANNHPASWLDNTPIQYSTDIPERRLEQRWHPPTSGQFTEYGPEDEIWMRPLGLGVITVHDCGPLFYKISYPPIPLHPYLSIYRGE